MADRSIRLLLTADVKGLVSGLRTASQATKDFAGRTQDFVTRNEQNISHLSGVLGGMGLALTAGFGYAVKTFADFDSAMSSVAAATMTTGAELDSLRQAAIEAGAATSFSATEAAGAIENLAKAGVSTADILNGGLKGALDLAAAGEMGVAEAAEIAATAMTQFNLSGDDMSHIADLLAAGAGKAQGDVTDLAAALKQSGLVASQFGLSIEETTGTLAAFASAGLLGSDAGTSFKTMLLALANPSEKSAKLMKELGINAYDAATGGFVGMVSLAGQLKTALEPLPQAQRDAAMATIFGSDAIRSANVLYQQGAEGIQKWVGAVDDQGYAAEQAAMRLDNLKGDLEALGGSFETLILRSGSGANEWLRGLVQGAESVVDALGRIPTPILNATTLLAGPGGLAMLGVAGLGKLAVGLNNAKLAIDGLGVSMRTAKIAAGALGGAIGVAAIGLTVWAQNAAEARARTDSLKSTLDEFGNATSKTLSDINDALSKDLTGGLDKFLGRDPVSAIDLADRMGLSVRDLTDYISGQADAIDRVNEATVGYLDSGSWLEIDDRTADVNRLKGTLDDQASSLTRAQKETIQKAQADEEAGVSQEELAGAYGNTTGAITTQVDALGDLISAQEEAAGIVLSEREAQRQLEESYGGVSRAIEEQISQLASQYEAQGMGTDAARRRAEAEVNSANKFDITTEAGRRNQAALDDIATSTWDVITAMQRNGADQQALHGVMATSRQRFIDVATAAGMGADEANALADELGLIPNNVYSNVEVETATAMARVQSFLGEYNKIQDRRVQITTAFVETGIRPPAGFYVPGNAKGGWIHGPGTGTSDSILRRLSNGEFVVNAQAARENAGLLEAINSGKYAGNPAVHSAPASVSSTTTTTSSRTLAPTIVTTRPVTERTVRNALKHADLLDY